ncbi:PucR family transcriptional regulator, partial [Leucobacter sp. OLES1]
MPLTLSAVARAVAGSCVPQRLSERTPVDGVARFDEVVVVGHPAYATLVTGDAAALLERLDAGGTEADALSRAVLVTDADDPALRERLAAHGTTAILG